MDPMKCRAARAVLNWSQPQLAEASGVSISTVRDFETGKRTPIANNLSALERALEVAGVQFLDTGDVSGGPGVALKPGG